MNAFQAPARPSTHPSRPVFAGSWKADTLACQCSHHPHGKLFTCWNRSRYFYATSWRCRSLSSPFISVDVNGPHKEKMHRSHAGACHLHCAVTINYRSFSYNGCCRCATIHARHARSSVHSLDEMTSPRSKVSQRVLPYCHVGTTTNHVISGHITNDLILFSGTLGDQKKALSLNVHFMAATSLRLPGLFSPTLPSMTYPKHYIAVTALNCKVALLAVCQCF